MNRKEEIKEQVQGRILLSCNFDQNLIGMAEWADETMIEKACKWLKENGRDYATYDDSKIMPSMRADVNIKRLIKDFRKAMEE